MCSKNIKKLTKEIINPTLDLSKDYAEIGLDEFIDNRLFKEIPAVKTLVAIIKTGVAIKERFFIKKFLVFLSEFQSNKASKEKIDKFNQNFEKNEKLRNKTTEQILVIIEELDSIKKTKILAHLFSAYLNNNIDWRRFISLASCLKSLQEITFDYLEILSKGRFNFSLPSGKKVAEIKKIIETPDTILKFSVDEMEALFMAGGIGIRSGTLFRITYLGQDLYLHGISKTLEKQN